jgi:hypothetical protein
VDTASDGQLWDERVRSSRADIAAQSKKAGDGSQGNSVLSDPACGTGGFLIAATNVLTAAHVLDFDPPRGSRKQLSDVLGRVSRVRGVRDTLDKQEAADGPLMLRISADLAHPAVVDHLKRIGVNLCRDLSVAPPPDLPVSDAPVPWAANWDAEPGAPWQTPPYYATRPFAARSCCGSSALAPEAVTAAWNSPLLVLMADSGPELIHLIDCMEIGAAATPLTVTILDRQLAQDYRQGLRCFVDVVLDVLGRMVVMILAALSQLVQAPSFLLVMLAAARRYGRRGEPDDHASLITRAHPIRHKGVACPAT